MTTTLDVYVAIVTLHGQPHASAIGLSVSEAERRLIDKLREDRHILNLVADAKAKAPIGDEREYFDREEFFDLLRQSEAFGYKWVEDTIFLP